MKKHKELAAFFLLLVLGLIPRLVWIARFPTIPISDFKALITFGVLMRDQGITSGQWTFNPGVPLVLSALFRIFPDSDPETVARLATVFACGLLGMLPFFIWRGVLPLWMRLLTGSALALWPGQIFFSGVVAQDNWALLPSIALGALAVRSLLCGKPARLITASLLYGAGALIRQEMPIPLFPLFLAAAGVNLRIRWRRAMAVSLAAALPLLAVAAFRYAATGHFSLGQDTSGVVILGSYVPGAAAEGGWNDPSPHIASVRPDLLRDRQALFAQLPSLALQEAFRRPGFHMLRMLSAVFTRAIAGERESLYWSVGVADVLPEAIRERGTAVTVFLLKPLLLEMAAIQGLFLAAVIIGVRRRSAAILVLASAVLLKYGIHAVTIAVAGRYFFAATALEILAIMVAVYEIRTTAPKRSGGLLAAGALVMGAACSLGLLLLEPRLAASVVKRDDNSQHTYHFVLQTLDRNAALACAVERGRVVSLVPLFADVASVGNGVLYANLQTLERDPAPGDAAVAVCDLTESGRGRPLVLQILDPYPPGGLPGRIVQRVELDGREIFSHDIAETPGSGWTDVPLGVVEPGIKRRVVVEVRAIRPDAGAAWGWAARTPFRLVPASLIRPRSVMGKLASQSSTFPGYSTAEPASAVDGNTGGNFFDGSVTHTDADWNAWWQVDLGASQPIHTIVIWNRTDCCQERLSDYWLFVSDTPFGPTDKPAELKSRAGTWSNYQAAAPSPNTRVETPGIRGRYIRVQLNSTNFLSLAEVQVER